MNYCSCSMQLTWWQCSGILHVKVELEIPLRTNSSGMIFYEINCVMNAFNTKGEQTSEKKTSYLIMSPSSSCVCACVRECIAWEEAVTRAPYRAVPLLRGHSVIPHWYHAKNIVVHCEREPPHPPPLYLWELINLFQSFLYLQASPVACDPIHHSHHRLLDHLSADEAFKDLGNLQTVFCIFSSELLHLKHRNILYVHVSFT